MYVCVYIYIYIYLYIYIYIYIYTVPPLPPRRRRHNIHSTFNQQLMIMKLGLRTKTILYCKFHGTNIRSSYYMLLLLHCTSYSEGVRQPGLPNMYCLSV